MITGLETVMANLNKQVSKIEGRTLKGLIRAVIIIRRDMDKTSPKIPVDLGNLRASFFTITSTGMVDGGSPSFKGEGKDKILQEHSKTLNYAMSLVSNKKMPVIAFGFGAYYAIFVHEMIGPINWKRPGSGAKFLENAIDRNKKNILFIIAKEAKV